MDGVVALIGNVNALITNDDFRSVPQNIGEMVSELRESDLIGNLNSTVESFQDVAESIAAAELAGQINQLLTEADGLVQNATEASAELPELLASLRDLADKAGDLPLESIVASTTELIDSTTELVNSTGIQELPPQVSAILSEIEGTLVEFRESGIVDNADAAVGRCAVLPKKWPPRS